MDTNQDVEASTRSARISTNDLRSAIAVANVPVLLMVLHQLTGSEKWLQPPFSPSRGRGLDTNPTGGFSEELQDEVREAAVTAVLSWAAGRPAAIPEPQGGHLTRMLSVCVGEHVPEEYAGLLASEMNFAPTADRSSKRAATARGEVLVVGAGVSGLAAAISLQDAGIPYRILEKNHDLGGTWYGNRYPGCGVDTPSHLYGFSYFPGRWETYFARREHVHAYLEDVADEFDLRRHINFGCDVTSARWDAEHRRWCVSYVDATGRRVDDSAEFLITAVGQLSRPSLPAVPGLDTFTGESIHSAEWPGDLEIDGKDVAVVGSGASAMQIVPAIVERVRRLVVVQRSPQWIAPNDDVATPVDAHTQWLLAHVPYYRAWYRAALWWSFGDRLHQSLRVDPDWEHPDRSLNAVNDGHRVFFSRYVRDQLAGRPDLIEKSLPTYPPFGKRMLLDNGWFRALKHPSCELITSALAEMTPTGLRTTDGASVDVDVVVFATGFEAKKLLAPMEITGRDGRSIRDLWGDENPSAYLGMTVPDFPNLFVLYGPNTNLGHGGSYIFHAECQVNYIVDLLTQMDEQGLEVVECRQDTHDDYNRAVDEAHGRLVWTHPGMDTWYRNSQGRVVTNSPWRMVDYWHMTRHADLSQYHTG